MRTRLRLAADKTFTGLTGLAVILICMSLVVILGPIIFKGMGAVFFQGTVEFRRMQNSLFQRGSEERLNSEIEAAMAARRPVYDKIAAFKQGVDPAFFTARGRDIYRRFSATLDRDAMSGEDIIVARRLGRQVRDDLQAAFEADSQDKAAQKIAAVLEHRDKPLFATDIGREFFALAEEYGRATEGIDLGRRAEYAAALAQVENTLHQLLGPAPGEPLPALIMDQFGATRGDKVRRLMQELIWVTSWDDAGEGLKLEKTLRPRAEVFAGTEIEPLFKYMQDNIDAMMLPKRTFYWQYFIDDSTPGHYFGGVGPEILGTLMITVIGMILVVPLGVVSAAYLVEVGPDKKSVRVIRLFINTLAGVPSIVFGLFGMAFFVLFVFPKVGLPSQGSMLAAGMTLAILTLPVMIRASEEAIRAVPGTFKEASLALGAGRFRTFVAVVMPAAMPGILTGAILSLSRIAGETAPILFTGAVALGPVPRSIFERTRTLSYGSYDMAVGDRIAMLVPHNQFGMVMTLVLLILVLNGISIYMRGRLFRRLRGH